MLHPTHKILPPTFHPQPTTLGSFSKKYEHDYTLDIMVVRCSFLFQFPNSAGIYALQFYVILYVFLGSSDNFESHV